ncbi:MAG: nucleotide exchange factor GrpE [Candidatus Doudnabacteria bacterium]|nr:nucleotide exchange factor GrpE [Candidatus Doudnabacteria bacterium]
MPEDNQPEEQSNIELLQQDLDAVTNNWKRALADFENYKKRKEAENKELVEFAREVAVVKLLPALDSLEQALKHMPNEENQELRIKNQEFFKKYDNWQTGVNGIVMQLDKALGELGVKKIEAVGKKFDPNFHEAVREVEGEQDHVVVDELQTGFELNGKLIRPSQVVISKSKSAN